jgi:FAD/FMN-containing dehydrogenase
MAARSALVAELRSSASRSVDAGVFAARARQLLGQEGVLTDGAQRAPFERDYHGRSGRALAVLLPANTPQVAAVLQLCGECCVAAVAQSGNTGLVGASIPDESGQQALISLRRLDTIGPLDAANRSITLGGGVRMSHLRAHLAADGFWFPFDIAADPCVGGMIASNTGGSHLMRYGDVRGAVLGLEAVLADGTIVNSLKSLRKDNSGFDCKQLFIGSGGALGVITGAVLQVQRRPLARVSALLVPPTHADIPELLSWLERRYGDLLISFEGMSGEAIRCAYRELPALRRCFSADEVPDYAVLIELASSGEFQAAALAGDLRTAAQKMIELSLAREVLTDDESAFWALRDAIPQALMKSPRVMTFDVAFARSALPPFRMAVKRLLETRYPGIRLADFGHFADGGDHLTVLVPDDCARAYPPLKLMRLRVELYDLVAEHGGSFSAEHGIGPLNESAYRRYMPPEIRRLHASIKSLLDPAARLGRQAAAP